MVSPEVVRLEEEEDATSRLIADESLLLRRCRAREQERRAGRTGRSDHDPALVLCRLMRVLHDGEVELLRVERHRLVIVGDDERDVGDALLHVDASGVSGGTAQVPSSVPSALRTRIRRMCRGTYPS